MLREADAVLVPVLAAAPDNPESAGPGRAESIIRAYVGADRIRRLEFALNDTGGVTPRRAAAWQAAAAAVAEEFAAGADSVAFGTLGDPNLYSTFSYLCPGRPRDRARGDGGDGGGHHRHAGPGLPGRHLAGRGHRTGHARPAQRRRRRPGPGAGPRRHRRRLQGRRRRSPAPHILRDRLHSAGCLSTAIIGARLGLPGELIAPAADLLRAPAPNSVRVTLYRIEGVESHSLPNPWRPPRRTFRDHSVPVHTDRPGPPGRGHRRRPHRAPP